MLFIFYLIRKCNLIWRWWSGCVSVCVCACVCWCVSSEWIGEQEMCVDRVTENERKQFSLCFFFPLSLLLSFLRDRVWIRMYRKTNWLIVFFNAWDAELPVGCFVTKHSKTLQTSSFSKCSLQILPESMRFWNPFNLKLSDLAFQVLLRNLFFSTLIWFEFVLNLSGCNHTDSVIFSWYKWSCWFQTYMLLFCNVYHLQILHPKSSFQLLTPKWKLIVKWR